MKTIRLSALILVLISLPIVALADGRQPDIIQLHSGPISGTAEDGMRAFPGIPYAAPPVGSLRWKPPQEVASWTDVRKSTGFGPSCPQPNEKAGAGYNEDCLYLNVWTPAERPDEKLPVMVWIHGGAFNFGSTSMPEYNGRNLAKKGVVVVTVNYRLGPLGFLVHPLLSKESPQGVSGNYGLLDQLAALKWVRRNIAAFGGDPGRVTIFGQSAGSRSVSLQMISPLSAGLFHGAIAQSGGPIIGSEYLSPLFNGDMANVSKMGQRLASRLGCDKADDVLAAMRAKSAEEIVKAADCNTSVFDDSGLFFAPVFDGRVLPKDPMAAFSNGHQHDVPIIVGSTLNEGNIYLAGEKDLSLEKYQSFLKSRFCGRAAEAYALFPAAEAKDVAPAIDRILTVGANAEPARLVARSMERMKSGAYLYRFTRLPDTALARRLGVHHGVDIAYVFGNMPATERYDDTDRMVSGKMMEYWVNFAKTGNPNGPGLKDWPAYTAATDINMEFSDTLHTTTHLYKKEADFISGMGGIWRDKKKSVGENAVDSHSAYVQYHFKDAEMDFIFGSLFLAAAVNHGAEIGEAFSTASRIKEGDVAGWQEQWLKTAALVEARGERSLAGGHRVSAREQLQRASYYYRAALIPMPPDDPRYRETALKSRALLKKAGSFLNPRLEYIEIPFEGTVLPGYFRKAAPGKKPAKTLIMVGGAETFAEDLYFYIAPRAFDRGYNFLTVDLPGQGLLPLEGKFLRSDVNVPLKAVVDYALRRKDVDPRRLAVYGYSTGGFMAPRAAMHDKRIKALAMSHCVVDGQAEVAAMPPMTPEAVQDWSPFKLAVNRAIAWRYGLKPDNLTGLPAANQGFSFDPAKVSVPSLILVAGGEYRSPEIRRQTQLCMDGLPNPRKRLVITPDDEGASGHCIMDNRSLMSQELFDWLDEVFESPL
jgi:para-nitrobenzyl esterase